MECNKCGGYMAEIYEAGKPGPVLWLCTAGCGNKAKQLTTDDMEAETRKTE